MRRIERWISGNWKFDAKQLFIMGLDIKVIVDAEIPKEATRSTRHITENLDSMLDGKAWKYAAGTSMNRQKKEDRTMDKTDEIIKSLKSGIESEPTEGCVCCKRWITLIEKVIKSLESTKAEPKMRTVCGSCGCEKLSTGGILVCGDCYAKLTKAEQPNWEKCKYCGSSRVVRLSGEWQFTCNCYDPQKRPKAEPVCHPDEEFTKEARELARAYGSEQPDVEYSLGPPPLLKVSKKLKEACDRLDAQQQEIETLKKSDAYDAENAKLKQDIGHLHGQGLALYESTKKEMDRLAAENKNLLVGVTALKMQIENMTAENKQKDILISKRDEAIALLEAAQKMVNLEAKQPKELRYLGDEKHDAANCPVCNELSGKQAEPVRQAGGEFKKETHKETIQIEGVVKDGNY